MKAKKKKDRGKPQATSNHEPAGSPMDVALLERLVKLMAANDLNTVDVRDGDQRVILKRGAAVVAPAAIAYPSIASPAVGSSAAQATSAAGASSEPGEESSLIPIKSPMVGTFYAAPAPDAKPFVSVGSRIDEDTDVCVIEAMKVFNNIKAETKGVIEKILVSNGETVEFGQVLFLVRP